MPYSPVENNAFRYRDDDDDPADCPLFTNGRGPFSGHCTVCDERLHAIALERKREQYRLRGNDGRIIVSDFIDAT